jgi:hypothetical protein
VAQRQPGNPPLLAAAVLATNPTSGDVMAESGAVLREGNWEVRLTLSQSAAAVYQLARRNAANGADISPFPIAYYGAAGQSSQYAVLVYLKVGERVRVTMGANLTGQSQVFLQMEEMG